MDRTDEYRAIIRRVLQEFADYHASSNPMQVELVCDDERGHYHVGELGWDGEKRVDNIYLHVDLIGDRVWVQRNWTDIRIAEELVRSGIPRTHIVLGFQPPDRRADTDYAAA